MTKSKEKTMAKLRTAHDLGAAVRDARTYALDCGVEITDEWCRDQMHDLGCTRYEDVDEEMLEAICARVD